MEINFGSNVVNTTIAFDWTENANYNFTNRGFWIHGIKFNGKVYFPYGATTVSVNLSRKLNRKVVIPNSVTNTASMFSGCRNFNQNIQIPNSVTNTASMFNGCNNFNQNIQIPNSVTNTASMFNGCSTFNQNIQIPNSVTKTASMFSGCRNFNQLVTIPNSVTNTIYMFSGCFNFNQNIQIPNSVTNTIYMFSGCNIISNISMRGDINTDLYLSAFMSMFRNNKSQSLNVHLNQSEWSPNTFANFLNSSCIEGGKTPSWDVIDNGYHNALYNIYIYTNAVFAD